MRWRWRSQAGIALVGFSAMTCNPRVAEFEERGDRYSAMGQYVDAQVEYRLALEEAGDDAPADLVMKAGALALEAKSFGEAARLFDEMVMRNPEYAERVEALYHLHAHRWEAVGDTFSALRAIEWLSGRDSTANLGSLHFTLGEAAYSRPDYDEAIREYLLGLSRGGESVDPRIFLHLGDAYERRRNCTAAIEYFQRYVDSTSEESERNRDARYRLGTCAFLVAERSFAVGDYRGAAEYAELMIRTGEPESQLDDADLLLGRVFERFGERTQAMSKYRQIVDRNPERQSRPVVEAYRRLMQLEFGMPLRIAEDDEDEVGEAAEPETGGEAP